MNDEKLSDIVLEHTKQIAALQESAKSAHRRIDRTDKLTDAVYSLAQSNAAIAKEVKMLASKFDRAVERIETGQKSQGERIGAIERDITQIQRNEKEISDMSGKLDEMRMAPGEKWKYTVFALIGGIITGGFVLIGNFLL